MAKRLLISRHGEILLDLMRADREKVLTEKGGVITSPDERWIINEGARRAICRILCRWVGVVSSGMHAAVCFLYRR